MRSRRQLVLAIGLLILVLLAASAVVGVLVKREPAFYAAAARPATYETRDKASRLMTHIQDLKNDIRTESLWGKTFTVEELNCFFAEMMVEKGSLTGILPNGFHSPRIAVEGDRLKLGVRYGEGFWSMVIWIELRVWLVADETNVMAVEVCDLRAGALGVGTQSILDAIADTARGSNIDVTWYRHNGNAVGLFKFFPDQPRPVSQVMTLDMRDGKIVVAGRSMSPEGIAAHPAGQ